MINWINKLFKNDKEQKSSPIDPRKITIATSEANKYLIFKNGNKAELHHLIKEYADLNDPKTSYKCLFYQYENWSICFLDNPLNLYDFVGLTNYVTSLELDVFGLVFVPESREKSFFLANNASNSGSEHIGGLNQHNEAFVINEPDMWGNMPEDSYNKEFVLTINGKSYLKYNSFDAFLQNKEFDIAILTQLNQPEIKEILFHVS